MDSLLTIDGELLIGITVDQPNRFVVRARLEDAPERVLLGGLGALEGTVKLGNETLCSPVDGPERAVDYDAITVRVDSAYVSARPAFVNDLFERVLARDTIPALAGYSCLKRKPVLPKHGRTDFLVEMPADETAFVEIKSCTCVEDGVAMFPNCQTEHGWCHLWSLETLSGDGHETHIVFVVQ